MTRQLGATSDPDKVEGGGDGGGDGDDGDDGDGLLRFTIDGTFT